MQTSLSWSNVFRALVVATLLSVSTVDVAFAAAVPAGPAEMKLLVKRDVWSPTVLYPHEGIVWRVGDHHSVVWSTNDPPAQITNTNGLVVLRSSRGFIKGPGGLGEPLASNFSLFDGRVEIEVPDVPGGDDYQVVLLGDSGNASPAFTIANSINF